MEIKNQYINTNGLIQILFLMFLLLLCLNMKVISQTILKLGQIHILKTGTRTY